MLKAPVPINEQNRLDTLRALSLLDSNPSERFDRITRLAKRLFGVPVALVSLVDADRQWFLSAFGIEEKETTRDISFCGHAILGDEIFCVPDASNDERFFDNPLVTGKINVQFYAGCPIKTENGSNIGTLCLFDNEPREFTLEDESLLRDLTSMVEQEVKALQMTTLDELTMISNRRGFEILSEHALKLCKRLEKTASLIFIDLDKFKEINDRFGHAEGDFALKKFAELLTSSLRDSDVIGRFGGDEFAIFLTNSSVGELESLLFRLESCVATYNAIANKGYEIQYSTGVVSYSPERHKSLQDLLQEGDELMYQKKNRKNEN